MSPAAPKPAYVLTWVTDHLAVGHAPMSYEQLASLREQGVNAILNLCAEFCDLHSVEAEQGFEVYYMPVPDEEAPQLEELDKALAWLDEAIYLGKKVLIHCRHGIGRTGTVLNAYLLRRGLGHKLAGKKLKGLKSKPSNFDQWWTIRKYGRNSKRLTVRAPCLEFKHLVDLRPFLEDYRKLAEQVDGLLAAQGSTACCGREHAGCCNTPLGLHLLEAVYLSQRVNICLSSQERTELIERSVAAAKAEDPDLILLDVMMTTKHEGFDVARELHEDPKAKDTPILMMTGIRREMNLPFGFEPDEAWLPVKQVLEKPVKPEVLLKAIDEHIRKS